MAKGTGLAPGVLAAGNLHLSQSRNSSSEPSTPVSLTQYSDYRETASIGLTSVSHIPTRQWGPEIEVGCQQEGGWMMGSYKRTSVCWQKVKVSEVVGRGICLFQAVMWATFLHHWWGNPIRQWGIPSTVWGCLCICLLAFLLENLISSLIGRNPYLMDIKACVILDAETSRFVIGLSNMFMIFQHKQTKTMDT